MARVPGQAPKGAELLELALSEVRKLSTEKTHYPRLEKRVFEPRSGSELGTKLGTPIEAFFADKPIGWPPPPQKA
jgi:hypothetical protein